MIGKLLNAIFNLIIGLTTTLLSPIDALIDNLLPSVSDALDAVNNMLDFAINSVSYAIDATGLSSVAIFIVVGYWVFCLTATWSISVVKLAIKWYKALVP